MTDRKGAEPSAKRQDLSNFLIARALATLAWERAWPLLVPPLCGLAILVSSAWFGLFDGLASPLRPIVLGAAGLAMIASLAPLRRWRPPGRRAVLRRLDQAAGVPHRPATSLDDRVSNAVGDPIALALWTTHLKRARLAAGRLRLGVPRPNVAAVDGAALRIMPILALTVAFFYAGDDRWPRLVRMVDLSSATVAEPAMRVDAWVTPPAYTRRPPLFLSAHDPAAGPVAVPENSALVIRVAGDNAAAIEASGETKDASAPQGPLPAGVVERHLILTGEATIWVKRRGKAQSAYRFSIIRDQPPHVAFDGEIKTAARGAMTLGYQASDDYGVASVEIEVTREIPVGAKPLYPAPKLSLPPPGSARSQAMKATRDVSEHPWAGAAVTMTLVARDAPGHEGRGQPLAIDLPGRSFANPLARALIEQRRDLALDANQAAHVVKALEALMIAPELFIKDAGHYLGLRTIRTHLARASTDDDVRGAVESLWAMALQVEEGNLSGAERQLKAAQQRLREAIERGASPEELEKLTTDLREALNAFLQEYARQQDESGSDRADQSSQPERSVTRDEINQMLDRLQEMAKSGARAEAEQLLSELNDILENLQSPQGSQSAQNPRLDEMERALRQMDGMIQRQRRLRDQTFQKNQQRPGGSAPQDGFQDGDQPQGEGQPGPGQQGRFGDLQDRQRQLRDQLSQLRERLQGKGGAGQGSEGQGSENHEGLGEAEQAMREAEESLRKGDGEGAVGQQGRALEALRQGARGLSQKLQQAGRDKPGGQGQRGRAQQNGRDPLGRPNRGRGGQDNTVKVPGRGESPSERAARVLDELRRRFSDPSRPQPEREYIERLLRSN